MYNFNYYLNYKNNNIIYNLVKDKYGNYVIQKMIELAELKSKEILVKKIISSNVLKKRDGFSKHVMGMIDKLGLNRFLENQDNNTPPFNGGNNNVQMFTKK